MIRLLLVSLVVALLVAPGPASAWWDFGHRTTAAVAEQNIAPSTRVKMQRLFASAALLGTPDCALETIEDASVWPDCIRPDRVRWGHTFPWHYQNVDICKPFDMAGACRGGNCVAAQIDRNTAILKNTAYPDHVRLKALAFLVHFVGDLHMPLHSGDRGDRGGNDVSAAYGIIEGRLNLHALWDGPLAERSITDGPDLVRRYDSAEKARLSAGSTEDWAREAWQIARDHSYPTAEDAPSCGPKMKERALVDNQEIPELVPITRLQIQRAGLRIARLLDEALS